jgi:CHASE1-domain containing sensor protein
MRPLRLLVDLFVNTFGITPPTPQNQAKAERMIAGMLAGVVVLLSLAVWLLRSVIMR